MKRRIENPIIGNVVTFVETAEDSGGERTLVEVELPPGGGNPAHYHDTLTEHFVVRQGRLKVHVDGVTTELGPGDGAEAPAGTRHWFRNASDEPVIFETELRPGHAGFEKSLRLGYALAADGRTNRKSIPRNPLHVAVLLDWSDMRLPGAYAIAERPLKMLNRVARRFDVGAALERRYLIRE